MIRLVALGGSGDVYLVCALYRAFCDFHKRTDVELIVQSRLASIPEMFGISCRVDDGLVNVAKLNTTIQEMHDNRICDDRPFYCHSSFVLTRYRVDQITAKWDASQADLYRMMLGLPPNAALSLPKIPDVPLEFDTVLVMPDAPSWPSEQPAFWPRLTDALETAGWHVSVNDWQSGSFSDLLNKCAASEWVIGPQTGIMAICAAARFPCRKTFVTPSIDDGKCPDYFASETYPYAYVTKFTGLDYDVQEIKITDNNHREAVEAIVHGPNGLRLWPHNPAPAMTIQAPLSPGDFLDRFAILTVKRMRFSPKRRAQIAREFDRYAELWRQHDFPVEAKVLFGELVELHGGAFDALERVVPDALNGIEASEHVKAIQLNRQRVSLKRRIDEVCHAPYAEVKSYYGDVA